MNAPRCPHCNSRTCLFGSHHWVRHFACPRCLTRLACSVFPKRLKA